MAGGTFPDVYSLTVFELGTYYLFLESNALILKSAANYKLFLKRFLASGPGQRNTAPKPRAHHHRGSQNSTPELGAPNPRPPSRD